MLTNFSRILCPLHAFSVGAPLNFENPMEVPDWQDWFSPMWLDEHKGERIGHGYRQFRAGGESAGAISMGYKFADGNQGLSAEELKAWLPDGYSQIFRLFLWA